MLANQEVTNAQNECNIDENVEMDVVKHGKIESIGEMVECIWEVLTSTRDKLRVTRLKCLDMSSTSQQWHY